MALIKKVILSVMAVLLLLPLVSALSFLAEITPAKASITMDGEAIFEVKITNNYNSAESFKIKNPNYPMWDIKTDPLQNPIVIEIAQNESKTQKIIITPLHVNSVGAYDIKVDVRLERTNELISLPIRIGVKTAEKGQYVPTVIPTITAPEEIDPRKELPISIKLNNQNILEMPELTIKVEGSLISDEIKTSLGPKEIKTVEIKKEPDKLTSPGVHDLIISALLGEEVIVGPITKKVTVSEYQEMIELASTKRLFKTEKNLRFVTNNADYKGKAKIETTLFKSLFSSTRPRPRMTRENGKLYLAMDAVLTNKSMEIAFIENYRPLFFIIFLVAIIVAFYYLYRSPLTIRKLASSIVKREGGISELKVVLNIKNRSKKSASNIELTDTIPNIIDIEKELSIGTLQPIKVLRHEKKGSIIKWIVNDLDVGEERVISYKIKSRLPILGDLNLPQATAKFVCNKRTIVTASNRLSVSA